VSIKALALSMLGLTCSGAVSAQMLVHARGGSACEDLSSAPISYGMIYDIRNQSGLPASILDIHDIMLAGGCVGCHNNSAAGGLRLNQPGFAPFSLLGVRSTRLPNVFRVVIGDARASLLYTILSCTPPAPYPIMPFGAARIPIAQRAMVFDWIQQGARAFDIDGNPISEVIFRDDIEGVRSGL
jgi:hypothetical protein